MGIVLKSLLEFAPTVCLLILKMFVLDRDPSMAWVYLGNFHFVFPYANIYFLELQYFSDSSYWMLVTVYINFCEKKLSNFAAFLSITRSPSAILMYFLCCCCSVQSERKNLMFMGALLSFLSSTFLHLFFCKIVHSKNSLVCLLTVFQLFPYPLSLVGFCVSLVCPSMRLILCTFILWTVCVHK